jgi:hypothetical protein
LKTIFEKQVTNPTAGEKRENLNQVICTPALKNTYHRSVTEREAVGVLYLMQNCDGPTLPLQ